MRSDIIEILTSSNKNKAWENTQQMIRESEQSCKWYDCMKEFHSLLDHPDSLVRNRAICLLAANVRWDTDNQFDGILSEYLAHISDPKPITARQCIKALSIIGKDKPQYIPAICKALDDADLSQYKDSMRQLIEKDIAETRGILTKITHESSKE